MPLPTPVPPPSTVDVVTCSSPRQRNAWKPSRLPRLARLLPRISVRCPGPIHHSHSGREYMDALPAIGDAPITEFTRVAKRLNDREVRR